MSEEKDLKQTEGQKEAPEEQAEQNPEPVKGEEPRKESVQKQDAVPQKEAAPVKESMPEKKEPPAPPKKEVTQKKEPVIIERPANCMKCNKHLQRKTWYYRNGGYYCSKRCWKLAVEAEAKKKEQEKK